MNRQPGLLLTLVVAATLALLACGSSSPGSSGSDGDPALLVKRCGGFGGAQCPSGYMCRGVSLASDGLGACRLICTPGADSGCASASTCESLGSSCSGEACAYCKPPACSPIGGSSCASGFACVDDGSDGCEPGDPSVPCPGTCVAHAGQVDAG